MWQLADTQAGGNRLRHQRRVRERGQLNQHDAMGNVWSNLCSELEGEARLAAPARAGQGQ